MTRALVYFEMDVDFCANVFGNSPCTASISNDPFRKCFNTIKTCQDRENFVNDPKTIRIAKDCPYLPKSIRVASASLATYSYTPGTISLGEDLGIRSSLTVQFYDHPHSDTGEGFDPYLSSRDYDPFRQGTLWGKFRARQPYLRGRPCRLILGYEGQSIDEMETHHFIIESFDGPNPGGVYTIVAKDVLKMLDDDRAQAPTLSTGNLVADINSAATTLQLVPVGIGEAEYTPTGYVAIGNKEIVAHVRGVNGNDSNCKLLLHFDGANAATSTTDSSSGAKTITRNGDAQLSTAQKVFGTASSLFDGTGDYWSAADSADWTFAGDFTLECRARPTSLAAARTLLCHSTDINNMYRLYITTTGRLQFDVVSSSSTIITLQSAAGLIVVNTWYHCAVVRSGNVFTLYLDGVAVGTVTDSDAIPNFTSTFKIGISGNGSSDPMQGYIDEVRVSSTARWTAAFTPPDSLYVANSDVLTITRAQFNTTAVDHKIEDLVQQCLVYDSQKASAIFYDLLVTYGGLDAGWCPLSDWTTEDDNNLLRLFSTCIAAPVGVRTLVCELLQQSASAMWWLDTSQTVRWQVLRSISTDAFTYNQNVFGLGSLNVQEQPDKRVSQVWIKYGQRNPLEPLENEDNYRSGTLRIASESQVDNASSAIKKIYSRWVPQFGGDIADRIGDIILSRYQVPPRLFSFEVFRADGFDPPILGGGYQITDQSMQDETGVQATAPLQLTRVRPSEDGFFVEGEEAILLGDPIDLNNRNVTIDSNGTLLNARDIHDQFYPDFVDGTGITINIVVSAGVVVSSTQAAAAATPALEIGSWPPNTTVNLTIRGRVQGKGGEGGYVNLPGTAGTPGLIGGTALRTRYAINLYMDPDGELFGGGGGGGGCSGGGGGGGAGTPAGIGGVWLAYNNDTRFWGGNGTADAGGSRGGPYVGNRGGLGGGPGLAGGVGEYAPANAAGGAAGIAIDGISYVTVVVTGDIRGQQVN